MNGNILSAKVKIKGKRQLLWHHFGEHALPLQKGEREGVPGNNPSEWQKTVLVTEKRQLYIQPQAVFGCVRDGAKFTRKGRTSIMPAVAATLQIGDDRVLIDRFLPRGEPPKDPRKPVYLDVRSVVNPSTSARNVRYRVAASPGWNCSFTLIWDRTVVSRSEMECAVRDAGRLVGLGDGRGLGMGRFDVLQFDVHEPDGPKRRTPARVPSLKGRS
jgi:hypothetical protein